MDIETALTVIHRAAGDELTAFFERDGYPPEEPRIRVSREALEDAVRLIASSGKVDLNDDEDVDDAIRGGIGEALVAWWAEIGSTLIRQSDHRARMRAFIEEWRGAPVEPI